MENDYVSRSRLFREAFLPGSFVRLRNHAYAKVVGVKSNSTLLEHVDVAQLKNAIASYIRAWESAGGTVDVVFTREPSSQAFVYQAPSELFVTPSPLMLICKTCKTLDFYAKVSDRDLMPQIRRRVSHRGNQPFVRCKQTGCSGEMVQLPYVAVHRCGHVAPIYIHFSAVRSERIGYFDAGSFFHSYFFNADTKEKLAGSLQDDCPTCRRTASNKTELNKRGTPLSNGESFFVKGLQFIALSETRGKLVSALLSMVNTTNGTMLGQTVDIAEALASGLVRLHPNAQLEQKLNALLSDRPVSEQEQAATQASLEKKRAFVARFEGEEPDEITQDILASTRAEIAKLEAKLAGSSGQFREVRKFIADDNTLGSLVSQRRTMESVFLANDVSVMGIEECIQRCMDPIQRTARQTGWARVRDAFGIENIAHIPDLTVVLAALGYTREKQLPSMNPDAVPVNLCAFNDENDESLRGKAPIYAMSARTEALWIRLDPRKVLRWCIEGAGWRVDDESILDSRERSHGFLLQASKALCVSPDQVRATDPHAGSQDSAPFHLLHSVAHALMRTARRHTGYDTKTITEYLLPMDLSMLLYVSSVQNYTAGGLLTLFNHYLADWFDDASMFAFTCAFDPICTDTGGACAGCLQTEIGCETFNYGLSRAYLHGGTADPDNTLQIRTGYWHGA